MNRKQITITVLIAFLVGAFGSVVFTHFIFPPLSGVRGFGWLKSLVSSAPIIINRTQEVQFTEGVDLADLVKQAGNITVSIYDPKNNFLGNGIIATSDGLIMTTLDAVRQFSEVGVMTSDGQKFTGTQAAVDPKTRLALFKIPATGLPAAQFDNAATLEPGRRVLYIGRGNVKFEHEVLIGYVTQSLSNQLDQSQVSTDIAAGADFVGGPIVNLSGHVVGLSIASSKNIVSETLQQALSNYLKK